MRHAVRSALLPAVCIAAIVAPRPQSQATPRCDADNGGITLPRGFCATVFADLVGSARHLAIAPNGTVFVTTQRGGVSMIERLAPDRSGAAILALRDTTGDDKADTETRLPYNGRTGIALVDSFLYVSDSAFVLRFHLTANGTSVAPGSDTIVTGMPDDIGHRTKSLALDDRGGLFVSVGSRSNACRPARGQPAQDPCSELPVRSGIWRYDANQLGQRHPQDGERWATGVRNAVGLAWNPATKAVYATSHGRDNLSFFRDIYSIEQNAETPTEEFFRVDRGIDIGWPYCFHDARIAHKVLAPEYGGDGRSAGRCTGVSMPLIGFPAHWGPNDLMFYTGAQFPPTYRGGAFIAFHGSWNRMPLPEAGYNVVFVPFRSGVPTGGYVTFADGFAGDTLEPVLARYRPTGLAQGPDGSLYIADDMRGRIWKVNYIGSR